MYQGGCEPVFFDWQNMLNLSYRKSDAMGTTANAYTVVAAADDDDDANDALRTNGCLILLNNLIIESLAIY